MSDRERCAVCLRELATAADWDRNGELSDEQAAADGLDDLCWEVGDNDCLSHAIELGRPTTYEPAMQALDSLRSQLREEYEAAESRANSFSLAPPGEVNSTLMLTHRGYARRLSKLLDEEGE